MTEVQPPKEPEPKPITKSQGQTRTEQILAKLCNGTFLKLWAYPNVFKADGKELCDLIAIFENHVFLFFDRESKKFADGKNLLVQWQRWEREVIQKQITTAQGAESYIKNQKGKLFLDAKREKPFPINLPTENLQIHKIVVAHGAEEACKDISEQNIYGSLAITYSSDVRENTVPFMVHLKKDELIHVFDSVNLEIVLSELDTFYDFVSYLKAKESAILHYDAIMYCGEEDLLAHYFQNFNDENEHYIGSKDKSLNGLVIGEGAWKAFSESEQYRLKKEADKVSYLWDGLLQYTSQNALDGTLTGTSRDIFNTPSAIREMAKEPRFIRRAFSQGMLNSFDKFPKENEKVLSRHLSFFHSFYPGVAYVILQFHAPEETDYDGKVRPLRTELLTLACGVARVKHPELKRVIGIAMEPPRFRKGGSEDFVYFDCENWSDKDTTHYEEQNKVMEFFESPGRTVRKMTVNEFPRQREITGRKRDIPRNAKCPCGSKRKYKNCCAKD